MACFVVSQISFLSNNLDNHVLLVFSMADFTPWTTLVWGAPAEWSGFTSKSLLLRRNTHPWRIHRTNGIFTDPWIYLVDLYGFHGSGHIPFVPWMPHGFHVYFSLLQITWREKQISLTSFHSWKQGWHTGWWFQPIWEILVKMAIFPK